MFNVGSVQGYLRLNTTGWNTSMRRSMASVTALSRSFMRLGVVATGSLFLIEREFGKFDKAIRHATSVSETTNEQFQKMSEMALDASVKWNKAASSTAQAFYFLGSAGLTVTEQLQAFNDTIMLSRAMGSELGQTVEGVVDIVRAFGLEFADITNIADQLTKTIISSNQQFNTLTQALSYASSTARLTNNTLAETTAMLGVMANAGIKGSMAGTVLRRAMTNLMAPTGAMAGLIYDLGLHIYDTSGKMKPFINIMGEISDKLRGATDEYKNMVFEVLFGRRAIAGQIMLFNFGSTALRKYANEIKNAGGTTERVAGKQMKAFTEQLGRLWREMQRIAILVGGTLAPAIERFGNMIRDRLVGLREYVTENKLAIAETLKWVTALGVLAIVVPPLTFVLISLVTQFGLLAKAMVSVAVAGMVNPFTLLIVSLYTLRAVLKREGLWDDVWSGFVKSLDWVVERTKDQFKALEWYAHKFVLRMQDVARAQKIGTPTAMKEALMPWSDTRTASEMERFSKAFDDVRITFNADLKEMGKTAVDIMAGVGDAVKTSLAEDIPKYIKIFTNALSKTSPALDAFLERIKRVVGNASTMFKVFMMEPDVGFQEIIDDMDELAIKLRAAQSELGNTNTALASVGRKVGYLAGEWAKALEKIFRPPVSEATTWVSTFTTALEDIRSAWADTIYDVIDKGGTLEDFLENMFAGILRSFNRFVSELLANEMLYALFGDKLGMIHGAPRLSHLWSPPSKISGLGLQLAPAPSPFKFNFERPLPAAPIQGGLGKMAAPSPPPATTIIIENNGDPVKLHERGRRFDGKRWVVNAVMEAINTDPNVRNAIRGG